VGSTYQRAGERAGYPFRVRDVAGPGQNGGWARKVPRGLFLFSVFFSFSFYRFLNYSNLLQFRFKSNQTRSCNILIIQAMF
jgi:hypothetical protein